MGCSYPPPPPLLGFALDGKFPGVGTRKDVAQSNSAILSILMFDFLFQLTSSFDDSDDDMHQFLVLVLI